MIADFVFYLLAALVTAAVRSGSVGVPGVYHGHSPSMGDGPEWARRPPVSGRGGRRRDWFNRMRWARRLRAPRHRESSIPDGPVSKGLFRVLDRPAAADAGKHLDRCVANAERHRRTERPVGCHGRPGPVPGRELALALPTASRASWRCRLTWSMRRDRPPPDSAHVFVYAGGGRRFLPSTLTSHRWAAAPTDPGERKTVGVRVAVRVREVPGKASPDGAQRGPARGETSRPPQGGRSREPRPEGSPETVGASVRSSGGLRRA